MLSTSSFSAFKNGFVKVLSSFTFVANNRLWYYFLFPFIADIILASSLFVLFKEYADEATSAVCNLLGISDYASSQHIELIEMLKLATQYVVKFLLFLLSAMIYLSLRKNLIVLFCSPMMSLLSDRVEEIVTNKVTPFNGPQFVRDLVRSALLSLRNVVVELSLAFLLFAATMIISLIGGPLALIAVPLFSVLAFLISSFYFGGSLVDYAIERRHLSIAETLVFNRSKKAELIGIGSAFHLLLLIPVVGLSLAIVLSTAGATRWYLEDQSPHQ